MSDPFLHFFQKKKAARTVYNQLEVQYPVFFAHYTCDWSRLSILCKVELRRAVESAMRHDSTSMVEHIQLTVSLHSMGM